MLRKQSCRRIHFGRNKLNDLFAIESASMRSSVIAMRRFLLCRLIYWCTAWPSQRLRRIETARILALTLHLGHATIFPKPEGESARKQDAVADPCLMSPLIPEISERALAEIKRCHFLDTTRNNKLRNFPDENRVNFPTCVQTHSRAIRQRWDQL